MYNWPGQLSKHFRTAASTVRGDLGQRKQESPVLCTIPRLDSSLLWVTNGMLRITVLAIFSHPERSVSLPSPQAAKLRVVMSRPPRVALLIPKPAVPRPCNKSTQRPGQGPLCGQEQRGVHTWALGKRSSLTWPGTPHPTFFPARQAGNPSN